MIKMLFNKQFPKNLPYENHAYWKDRSTAAVKSLVDQAAAAEHLLVVGVHSLVFSDCSDQLGYVVDQSIVLPVVSNDSHVDDVVLTDAGQFHIEPHGLLSSYVNRSPFAEAVHVTV